MSFLAAFAKGLLFIMLHEIQYQVAHLPDIDAEKSSISFGRVHSAYLTSKKAVSSFYKVSGIIRYDSNLPCRNFRSGGA
jgi:polyisoprenoid-binding protein YceI